MKKFGVLFVSCLLLTLYLNAQIGTQTGALSTKSTLLNLESKPSLFPLVLLNSLSILEINAIQQISKEKKLLPLNPLPQPNFKLLKENQIFRIQRSEWPLWRTLNQRIEPVDIPVWKAVSVTKSI